MHVCCVALKPKERTNSGNWMLLLLILTSVLLTFTSKSFLLHTIFIVWAMYATHTFEYIRITKHGLGRPNCHRPFDSLIMLMNIKWLNGWAQLQAFTALAKYPAHYCQIGKRFRKTELFSIIKKRNRLQFMLYCNLPLLSELLPQLTIVAADSFPL